MGRPYKTRGMIHDNDPMHMIWHDHKSIQANPGELERQMFPFCCNDPPHRVQPHLAAYNLSKQTFPLPGAAVNKIHPCLGVIIPRQADGMTVMFLWIEFQTSLPYQ
jgi:hypothetical protein